MSKKFNKSRIVHGIKCLCGLSLFLCSCTAYHSGSVSTVLLPPKSKVVDIAMGTAKAHYFFGLGGVHKDGLVLEAKKELYRGYPLKENQAYGNMTLDTKRSFYLFYWNTKVILSADIIDYDSTRNQSNMLDGKVYGWIDKNRLLADSLTPISVGDSVFFQYYTQNISNAFLGRVLSIKKHTATVGRWTRGEYRKKKVDLITLLPIRPFPGCDAKTKYKIGEKVRYEAYYDKDRKYVLLEGIIVNVVRQLYLVQSEYKGRKFYYMNSVKYLKHGK